MSDKNTNPYLDAVDTLTEAFRFFNKELCNGELDTPIITILSRGRKSAYGWMAPQRWKNGEGAISEISISAEYLSRDARDVFETLIHEMVHYYNDSKGIEDCNKYQYHNKKFKERAEEFGLNVIKHKYRGWATTELGDKGKELVSQFMKDSKFDKFNIARKEYKSQYKRNYFASVYEDDKRWIRKACEQNGMNEKELMDSIIYHAQNSGYLTVE